MGALGRINPWLALWVPYVFFCAFCYWMFQTLAKPGGQPIGALERGFAKVAASLMKLLKRQRLIRANILSDVDRTLPFAFSVAHHRALHGADVPRPDLCGAGHAGSGAPGAGYAWRKRQDPFPARQWPGTSESLCWPEIYPDLFPVPSLWCSSPHAFPLFHITQTPQSPHLTKEKP